MAKAVVTQRRVLALIGTAAVSALLSAGAAAEAVLEEVIVTATLRAQSLQDVPVSVNAVSGDKLMEAGLDKIEDLQAYVPNLTMSETGIGSNIYVRGIGSGINQGFEQSVGMYFDGVSYGRAQLTRAPFLDLARVEVLRGPQNILFGKNSIGGALSLHSARPTDSFEGLLSALYEVEHGEKVVDAVLSGPLTDSVNARLALRKREMDGYIENLTLDRDEPARDELTARLLLDWRVTGNLQALLKLEHGQFDVVGRQIEIISDQPSTHSSVLFNGKTYAQILDNTSIPPFVAIDAHSSVLNNRQDYKRSSNGDFSDNRTQNLTLQLEYAAGEHSFTSITAYMAYDYDELCDCDMTGAEVFSYTGSEDYRQYSQELRWASPVGGTVEALAGVYFHQSELEFFDTILITSDILPGLLNLKDVTNAGAQGRQSDGAGDAGDEVRFLGTPRDFSTDTELFSAFLQLTVNVSDSLRFTAGARYSDETKEGARKLDYVDNRTGQRRVEGEIDSVMGINFLFERHDLAGERSERNLAPSLNLQYDLSEDAMLYTSWSRGFKSGGFDARSNAAPAATDPDPGNPLYDGPVIGSFEYEEEQSESYELGLKTTLLGGAAELNIAAFYTEFDDLQVSIYDGTLGFNVGNAGAAETRGVEIDGRLALSEQLLLTAALAWLDFEFTDFKNGQCHAFDDDPDGDGLCDYTGKTNQYAADYSGNIGLAYHRPFAGNYEFRGNLDVVFTDDYHRTQQLDPTQIQDGYYLLNARLALGDMSRGWELALVGKNLTDEAVVTYANYTPLANSSFESVGHFGFVSRPRSLAMQASYRW